MSTRDVPPEFDVFLDELSEDEIAALLPRRSGRLHCLGPLDRPLTASEKSRAIQALDEKSFNWMEGLPCKERMAGYRLRLNEDGVFEPVDPKRAPGA